MNSLHIPRGAVVAVACSGGPDSMALALLAAKWAAQQQVTMVALTVDHGLREASAKEAKQVGIWLKKYKLAHHILKWVGKKPASNIQETARKARYRLMADYCHAHHIAHLLVAHTQEDQAETFLLRLARGSGVDGLAAMATQSHVHDIALVRPLLEVTKKELLQYLKTQKQAFISDPSNENTAFDRIKIRKLLPELAKLGLSSDRLAKTAANMARARAHLEEETGKFLTGQCKIFPEGYALLRQIPASEEIALRALSTLIMCIGGQETKTRLNDLERLYREVKKPDFRGATLGGCIFARHKKDILICREVKAAAGTVPAKTSETFFWDNRYEVKLLTAPQGVYVWGALGQDGWLHVARVHAMKSPVPDKRILYTLPALRDKDGWLFAVPHLGLAVEGVKCEVTFNTPI